MENFLREISETSPARNNGVIEAGGEMKRNIGMHTSAQEAKRHILVFLSKHGTDSNRLAAKSVIGRVAYPGYDFKSPQGAAFAVAKIVRELEDDGLVRYESHSEPSFRRGHYITAKGLEAITTETGKMANG